MKVGLFLPTYNVEASLGDVLQSLTGDILARVSKVLIVDNGSYDKSLEIAIQWANQWRPNFVSILKNEKNYSLGGSTIVAVRKAEELDLDWLICMHTDGQAQSSDLKNIIEEIYACPELDLVSGSRFLKNSDTAKYNPLRKWANLAFCYLQQPLLRQRVFDIGAFLAFNIRNLAQIPYDRVPHDMGYHPALVLYWSRARTLQIKEIPIRWGEVGFSNVRLLEYGKTHLWRIIQLYLGLFRIGPVPELPTQKIL